MANINDIFGSAYLKASDLKGVDSVRCKIKMVEFVELNDGTKPLIHFEGKDKGLVCNKTNAQAIASAFGPETNGWAGKSIELFVVPTNFNGQMVDSIRARPLRGATEPAPAAPAAAPLNDDIPF